MDFSIIHDAPPSRIASIDKRFRLTVLCEIERATPVPEVGYIRDKQSLGEAMCAPMDKFDKAKGRTIALNRAFNSCQWDSTWYTRERRKAIFSALKEKGMKLW